MGTKEVPIEHPIPLSGGSEALTLDAVTEAAGQPVIPSFSELTLPIKVNLVNAVLGSNCYIGSNSKPITSI
jgi:hypothetical protein